MDADDIREMFACCPLLKTLNAGENSRILWLSEVLSRDRVDGDHYEAHVVSKFFRGKTARAAARDSLRRALGATWAVRRMRSHCRTSIPKGRLKGRPGRKHRVTEKGTP